MARPYAPADTRRREIAEAALQVLMEEGARGFTARKVAERVAIADGSLFRHFQDMQAIAVAALDALEAEMFASETPVPGDPAARLEAFFRHRASFIGDPRSPGRLIFTDHLQQVAGAEGLARVTAWRARNLALVRAHLDALAEEGRLRAPVPPVALLPLVQGALLTFGLAASLPGAEAPESLQARVDQAWSTLAALILR
jgi:AcrR family transcriptional regulator